MCAPCTYYASTSSIANDLHFCAIIIAVAYIHFPYNIDLIFVHNTVNAKHLHV